MMFDRKINKIPELYITFARKIPKFYMIIDRKNIFSRFFSGAGGTCPLLHPVSYACASHWRQTWRHIDVIRDVNVEHLLVFHIRVSFSCDCMSSVFLSVGCSGLMLLSSGLMPLSSGLMLLVEPAASMLEVVVVYDWILFLMEACSSLFQVLLVYDWILERTLFHSERTVVLRRQWKKKINSPWRLTQTTNSVWNIKHNFNIISSIITVMIIISFANSEQFK